MQCCRTASSQPSHLQTKCNKCWNLILFLAILGNCIFPHTQHKIRVGSLSLFQFLCKNVLVCSFLAYSFEAIASWFMWWWNKKFGQRLQKFSSQVILISSNSLYHLLSLILALSLSLSPLFSFTQIMFLLKLFLSSNSVCVWP